MYKNVLFLALLITFLSCTKESIKYSTSQLNPTKKTILVTVLNNADSQFKKDLIDSLSLKYSPLCNIKVINAKNYQTIASEQYDLLVVMDKLKAGLLMNKGFKSFISKADKQKTVFLMTAGDPKWTWKKDSTPVITSASVPERKATVLKQLFDQIDSKL